MSCMCMNIRRQLEGAHSLSTMRVFWNWIQVITVEGKFFYPLGHHTDPKLILEANHYETT